MAGQVHPRAVVGVPLGDNCMVGAGSVVRRCVLANELVYGNPARHRGWVCRCGRVVSRATPPPAYFVCPDCEAP